MRFNKNLLKLVFLFALIFGFSLNGFGQSEETEDSPVVVPEQAMEQVVRRILIWQFKPRKKPTTIYLAAEGIKQSWLPEIKNIKFELLSEEEIKENNADVYFFTKIEKTENKFDIGYGFGNPYCNNEGVVWSFRISKQKVKLWRSNGAFISHCYD